MMSFLLAVVTSRYPTTKNQLRNSSKPKTYTPGVSGSNSGKQRTVIYLGIAEGQATQTVITHNDAYQADDLDSYDFDVIPSSDRQSQQAAVQNSNTSAQQDALILSVIEQLKNQSQEKALSYEVKRRELNRYVNTNKDTVKKDIEEIETIKIELEHRMSMLITENEHLKQTYKQLYDSIKPTRKGFGHYKLKNELRKLKGKDLANNVVTKHPVAPEMLKVDVEPIAPKLLNNRTAHSYYLKHTQEQATILREVRVKPSTSASGPQPSGIQRKIRFNRHQVVLRRINFCMLSDNHDLCVLDFINDVNARAKSKSVKKSSKRKVWKPTGKVFTNIRYTWRPTGRTFTIVGNACPLTRITTTAEVPLRKPTALEIDTPKPVVTLVYSRKTRKSKTNVIPLSKLRCRLNYSLIGNVTISRVYYVEGLGHNLFSVGQFCDSNLEVAFR
ncbi:hypothetical protein Tco_0053630 [Tanacetum coccineum]